MKVLVRYGVEGSTQNDEFTCDHASIQIHAGGVGNVKLANGVDAAGDSVDCVLYGNVWRIERRP